MDRPLSLTEPGHFVVGANYVASHAGTRMWADWRPEVVAEDLKRLSQAGLDVLRVLVLWPDFQPLNLLRGGGGAPVEFRHGEDPLPDDEYGRAGLSRAAMAHFAEFLDLAQEHDLGLIVALLTGWMSGRLFVPPAFEGLNVLTDPVAIQWEVRFVRAFVEAFKGHPTILGWDLGNECNCMAPATREQAWVWTATIANAIRLQDPTRPIVSGMHGLSPVGAWRMEDQAELTDLLTVHPYPVFTPHCDQDPVNTIRTILHGTAEARYYADLGGKPCLCEEIGTLGPLIASEAVAADFMRSCLFSLWANDCHGLLPWCAYDLAHLAHTPYDWHAVERELGLLRLDGSPKPVLETLTGFRRFLDDLPFPALPPRTTEAVCILTDAQDHWGVAYSAFILAKQAGFDLEFQYETQPIREAPVYLLPCLSGHRMISRRRLEELLAKVEAGATLYLSLDTGLPSGFEPLTGLEPETRERRQQFEPVRIEALAGCRELPCGGDFKVRFRPTRATVLGREADGNPAFTVAPYGRGQVYFLSVPLEMLLTRTPGAFHAGDPAPAWCVYAHVAEKAMAGRAVRKGDPMVAVTEHPLAADRRVIVALNQSPVEVAECLALRNDWRLGTVHYGSVRAADGEDVDCVLPPNEAAVFEVQRG